MWKPFKSALKNVSAVNVTANYVGHFIFVCHQKLNEEALERQNKKQTLIFRNPSFINFAEIFCKILSEFILKLMSTRDFLIERTE